MRALYIDSPGETLLEETEGWSRAAPGEALSLLESADWDVVLIGGGVPTPLALAQSIRRLDRLAEILVVTPAGDENIGNELLTTPFLDEHVRCLGTTRPDEIRKAARDAAEGTRLRRRHRNTLASLAAVSMAAGPTRDRGSPSAMSRRDEVLATVAHDLRNPLTTISSTLSLVEAASDPGMRASALERGRRALRLMERLISDLLDAAAIDRGSLSVRPAPCSLAEVFAELADIHGPEAKKKGIELLLHGADGVTLHADSERLVQALGNLVGNSVKFTRQGTVRIAARRTEDRVVVSIADTGPGLEPGELDRLFDRYWQGQSSEGNVGLGLGLAIARGIVESHGGRIEVESQPGKGTTFHVDLSAAAPATE